MNTYIVNGYCIGHHDKKPHDIIFTSSFDIEKDYEEVLDKAKIEICRNHLDSAYRINDIRKIH